MSLRTNQTSSPPAELDGNSYRLVSGLRDNSGGAAQCLTKLCPSGVEKNLQCLYLYSACK